MNRQCFEHASEDLLGRRNQPGETLLDCIDGGFGSSSAVRLLAELVRSCSKSVRDRNAVTGAAHYDGFALARLMRRIAGRAQQVSEKVQLVALRDAREWPGPRMHRRAAVAFRAPWRAFPPRGCTWGAACPAKGDRGLPASLKPAAAAPYRYGVPFDKERARRSSAGLFLCASARHFLVNGRELRQISCRACEGPRRGPQHQAAKLRFDPEVCNKSRL